MKQKNSFPQAIADRNFKEFGEITMKDSNQFHAVCLDTYPPCVYMTDVSHRIAAIVHGYNKNAGETCVSNIRCNGFIGLNITQ